MAANVQAFLSKLRPAALGRARRSRVHGVRQFDAHVSVLVSGLGMVRNEEALLDGPRLGVAEAPSQLGASGIVVVASGAPYTYSMAKVPGIAAANTLNVIAITRSSPLARQADHASFIPHASSSY